MQQGLERQARSDFDMDASRLPRANAQLRSLHRPPPAPRPLPQLPHQHVPDRPNDPKGLDKEIEPTSVIDYDRHDDGDSAQPKDDTPALAPTPVLVDNKSVEFAVNNPETSQRTRHLETRYFKVRDYVRQHAIRVRHIRTDVNVADFFTKALEKTKFMQYRSYLGMENFDPSGG